MDGVFQWIKNITYYLIFISLISNLMPNGKYDRYIKLFSGAVFILIVAGPLTKSLKLDEKLAYAYEQIRFVQDTGEFEQKLWGIETERMGMIIRQYEEAVAQDVKAMAEAEGYRCEKVAVQIEGNADSERFGQVVGMELVLEQSLEQTSEPGADAGQDWGEEAEEIPADSVKIRSEGENAIAPIEPIRIQAEREKDQTDIKNQAEIENRTDIKNQTKIENQTDIKNQTKIENQAETEDQPEIKTQPGGAQARARRARDQKEQEALYGFQRKVAGYYGLKETDIRIAGQDD